MHGFRRQCSLQRDAPGFRIREHYFHSIHIGEINPLFGPVHRGCVPFEVAGLVAPGGALQNRAPYIGQDSVLYAQRIDICRGAILHGNNAILRELKTICVTVPAEQLVFLACLNRTVYPDGQAVSNRKIRT